MNVKEPTKGSFATLKAKAEKGSLSSNFLSISSYEFVTIGNHSHSHDYLIDWTDEEIKSDLEKSIKIFKSELGHSPKLFSYPFGEYSTTLKKIVADLNFEFAFGQHSGVIDISKDFLEMWPSLHIEYDQFIRTTDIKHKSSVQQILKKNLFLFDLRQSCDVHV